MDLFKKAKYDIDFSDKNLAKLNSSCEALIEQLEMNKLWGYVHLIKDINKCAANFDFEGFRNKTTDHSLIGTINSINDGVFEEHHEELKSRFRATLELIIEMGHNHPDILRTIKSL